MCLDKLTKRKTRKKYFYKIFYAYGNRLLGYCYNRNGENVTLSSSTSYQRNRWLNSVPCETLTYVGEPYTTGFHCFVNEADAVNHINSDVMSTNLKVFKVEVEDIMYTGKQYGFDCIVARRMRICP